MIILRSKKFTASDDYIDELYKTPEGEKVAKQILEDRNHMTIPTDSEYTKFDKTKYKNDMYQKGSQIGNKVKRAPKKTHKYILPLVGGAAIITIGGVSKKMIDNKKKKKSKEK